MEYVCAHKHPWCFGTSPPFPHAGPSPSVSCGSRRLFSWKSGWIQFSLPPDTTSSSYSHSHQLFGQTTPPLLAHTVYYSFFHYSLAPTPPHPTPQPSMISPSCSPSPPHPVPLCCKCTFVPSQEFLWEKSSGRGKLIKQTTTALKWTDRLLCTARAPARAPAQWRTRRLSEVQGQEDRKGHQLHVQDRRVKRNVNTSTRGPYCCFHSFHHPTAHCSPLYGGASLVFCTAQEVLVHVFLKCQGPSKAKSS